MKQKINYIILLIFVFFIGVAGTYVVLNKDTNKTNDVLKTMREVNITETNTIKSGIEKVYNSVLVIKSYQGDRLIGTGTGFVYKKDKQKGYVITNHHVILDADTLKVVNMNGQTVTATLLGSDAYSDIAVLSIDDKTVMGIAVMGDSTSVNLGDTLFTVGTPMGEEYKGTVTKGILSGKDRTVSIDLKNSSMMMEVLQTDAAINPGNSGGPLVNINGEVIGVNSMKLIKDEIEGMGFAIPIELVKSELDKLENGKKISRPIIGATLVDASNTYALYYNNILLDKEMEHGVVVSSLKKGFSASEAGLKKGDVIIEINGVIINNTAHFRYVLYKYEIGSKLNIKYYRKGLKKETIMILKEEIDE